MFCTTVLYNIVKPWCRPFRPEMNSAAVVDKVRALGFGLPRTDRTILVYQWDKTYDRNLESRELMIDRVRELVADHGGLAVDVAGIAEDADLYRAGMTSFASVQLMLALEEEFDIEFPETMLSPRTFASLSAIQAAVGQLSAAA